MTYTATIIKATDKMDTLGVYDDSNNKLVSSVDVVPTGHARDYENALRSIGFNPVAFGVVGWTVRKAKVS